MTNFSLIITAGGSSSRYGKNKLLEIIGNKTVIEHTISVFLNIDKINEIIIPTNESFVADFENLFSSNKKIKIITGGDSRQESVHNALQYVSNEYVIIHDGARPLIKEPIILQVMDMVKTHNAVSVMTKTTDTIKEVNEDGRIIKTIDRSKLYNTQTPQAFRSELILSAHQQLKNKQFTDDASMLEELDIPVFVIIGSYTNIKITTKSDLDFAKLYI